MNKQLLKELEFDEMFITECKKKINPNLKEYIENKIVPEYQLNDGGHNINHINYVLKRAIEISKYYEINYDILYACVMFHDIACHIDRENHEKLSADRAYNDEFLNSFFNPEEINIIKEAVEDHRASSDHIPRNIYGKILSSADRKVEIKVYMISSMSFEIKKHPEKSKEQIISDSYEFAIKKFGKSGYAVDKTYVNDIKYKQYLKDLQYLIDNKNKYYEIASQVYEELIG